MAEIITEDGKKLRFHMVVIEGPDGVGKTTASTFLTNFLRQFGVPYMLEHFPQQSMAVAAQHSTVVQQCSTPVQDYLKHHLPIVGLPYAQAHIYTQDRLMAWYSPIYTNNGASIRDRLIAMCESYSDKQLPLLGCPWLICDRYTQASEVYQGVEMIESDRLKFAEWLEDYEYNKLGLPRPDKVIWLTGSVEGIVAANRTRALLAKKDLDIYEGNNQFLADVIVAGDTLAIERGWEIINVIDKKGERMHDAALSGVLTSMAVGRPLKDVTEETI